MKLYRITYRTRSNAENCLPIIAFDVHDAMKWFVKLQPEAFKITHCSPTT